MKHCLGVTCFSEHYRPVSLHKDLERRKEKEPLGAESERKCAQQPWGLLSLLVVDTVARSDRAGWLPA